MKVDPRGVVNALRRAAHEGDRRMEAFLADEITGWLERLDAIEASATQKAEADSEITLGGAQPVSNRPSTDGESE